MTLQRTALLFMLLLGAGLTSLAAQSAEPVQSPSTAELEAAAIGAIQSGDFQQALEHLEAMGLGSDSTDVFLLRQKAFCLVKTQRYRRALAAAERVLELDPQDSYAAFYRAQALSGINETEAAARQLAAVIQQQPASAAAELVKQEMPETAERLAVVQDEGKPAELSLRTAAPGRISGRLSTGLAYDSNPGYRPRGASGVGRKSSAFWEGSLALSVKAIDQTADQLPLSVSLDSSLYLNRHFQNPYDELDFTLADSILRISRSETLWGRETTLSARGGFRYAWLDNRSFYHTYIAGAEIAHQLTPSVNLFAQYEWNSNNFDDSPDFPEFFARDGDSHFASAGLSAWVVPQKLWLRTGYTFQQQNTSGTQLEQRSHGGFVSAFLFLPAEIQLGLSASYGNPRYLKYLPAPERADDVWDFSASLRRKILRDNLEAALTWRYLHSGSNQSFADYDRHLVSLGLHYSF